MWRENQCRRKKSRMLSPGYPRNGQKSQASHIQTKHLLQEDGHDLTNRRVKRQTDRIIKTRNAL
jgi:hypothetical protein